MIISWIIYFVVAVACGIFFVLYKDLLALILFLSILCLPVILFVIHLISFLCSKIEVIADKNSAGIDNPVKVMIRIKNNSPFPVTHIKMTAKCKNLFLNTEHDCKFVVNSSPFSIKEFAYEMDSKYIGNIDFVIKKASFYDFFSLFRLTKNIKVSKIIPVFPSTVSVSVTIRPNDYFAGESDIFSTTKAGDDPSEVFNIREYTEGDKLNRIHWKLTTKTDKYMVKDYSLPVNDNIFIYVDLKTASAEETALQQINSLIKCYASVSLDFAQKGIAHVVCWYNCQRHVFNSARIAEPSDVYLTLSRIYSDSVFTNTPMMEKCDILLKNRFSHIIFMSTNSAKEVETAFAEFELDISLVSIVCVEYERSETPSYTTTEFIPVVPGHEEKCLYDIRF